MSDGGDYDPEWWKAAKQASLERQSRVRAASAIAQPGDAFLIVTEGKVTEPVYLKLLRADLQLAAATIVVAPGDSPHPRDVIKTAHRLAKEQARRGRKGLCGFNEPTRFDHVWAVIDGDVAAREGIWNDLVTQAASSKVRLAPSTPCFEFWLILHFGYTTRGDLPDGDSAKAAVKEMSGMEPDNEKSARDHMPKLIHMWPTAVKHAEAVRRHHEGAGTPLPANPSTDMDILAKALHDALPPKLKRLQP